MKTRLDYDYVDMSNNTRVRLTMGIPQGGIDSPYLFNIVFHELDKFVTGNLQSYLDKLNSKAGLTPSGRRPINKARRNTRDKLLRMEKRVLMLRLTDFE